MNDKMIEEMAKVMAENWFNETIISTAERLINAGYRKIPEGSVVVDKEYIEKKLQELEEQVRKETAEKYRKLTQEAIERVPHAPKLFKEVWKQKNNEIAEEFGVEVEE